MTRAATVTAAEIAQAMGVAKSTIIRRAQAEAWAYNDEPAQGGLRRLYTVADLPPAMRAKLLWQGGTAETAPHAADGRAQGARAQLADTMAQRAQDARRSSGLRQSGELSPKQQARMDHRLAILRALDLFTAARSPLPAGEARTLFVQAYNSGKADVSAQVLSTVPRVSGGTLERWQRDVRQHGITALAGAYGNRAGTGVIDSSPELRAFVQAMLVQYPHVRGAHVMNALRARFGADDLPSARTLERWLGEWRQANAEVLLALANPDAWKNKYMVAHGSKSEQVLAINELWERDSSPADLMCSDGRYALIGGIDVFTRSAWLLVARTSRAVAVGAHLRAGLLRFGVPQRDKTDNGSDYTAAYTERVYDGLDIKHELCPPFQPWHKPHIERFFRTFAHDVVELMPGYIGHSVADRKAIEARKSFADRLMKRGEVVELRITGAELQAFCDQWCQNVYDRQPHEGLGQRTPFEVRSQHASQVRVINDTHALDVLLADAPGKDGRRTVRKKGIEIDRPRGAGSHEGWYIAPELALWVGREVRVRFDPFEHDLGRVHVFEPETLRFICVAEDPSRTGIDRREAAIKAKAMQRDRVQAERKVLRAAAKKIGVDQAAAEILRERAAAAGRLVALPSRGNAVHTSAGLQGAGDAARAAMAPRRTTADIEHLAELQAARERIEAQMVPKGTPNELAARRGAGGTVAAPVFGSVDERVHWLLAQARVRELGTEEQDTLAQYRRQHPAAYRRMAALVAEQLGSAQENGPDRVAGGAGPERQGS